MTCREHLHTFATLSFFFLLVVLLRDWCTILCLLCFVTFHVGPGFKLLLFRVPKTIVVHLVFMLHNQIIDSFVLLLAYFALAVLDITPVLNCVFVSTKITLPFVGVYFLCNRYRLLYRRLFLLSAILLYLLLLLFWCRIGLRLQTEYFFLSQWARHLCVRRNYGMRLFSKSRLWLRGLLLLFTSIINENRAKIIAIVLR